MNTLSNLWSLLLKKHTRKFQRIILCHKKNHRHTRRMNYPEGYVQKGEYQKVTIRNVSHPQIFFCMTQGLFSKVKHDMTRSKISANKSEKLVNHHRLFFLFCDIFTYWERKQHLLYPVLDQWIKKAQGSRSASFNRYIFEVYKKLEDNEEVVKLLNLLRLERTFNTSFFLNLPNTESYLL